MPSIDWNRRWAEQLQGPRVPGDDRYYGQRWGDPEMSPLRSWWERRRGRLRAPGNLRAVARRYVRPHARPEAVALEIGPGGGRWTKLLLRCREVILVELNPEFFPYLRNRFPSAASRFRCYHTDGYEMDGVDDGAVDFVFSFGTFVHIDADGVAEYLQEIGRVLRPGGVAVIQYAAKDKPSAQKLPGFADMDASRMERLATRAGLAIARHDTDLLDHSNIIELVGRV